MTEKTTVGIDKDLRKTIKKLAAWLDISQGEVVKRAISEYERKVLQSNGSEDTKVKNKDNEVDTILQKATNIIWAEDPKTKEIQQKLLQGSETIDDFIANNWDSGLE